MPSPGYKAPSTSTFGQIRGPIVNPQGYVSVDFQRYMVQVEAKINQSLSVAGNTVLNNIKSATATTNDPTVTGGASVDLPEMSVTLITKGNPVLVIFSAIVKNNTAGGLTACSLLVDNVAQGSTASVVASAIADAWGPLIVNYIDTPLPGSHTYKIVWSSGIAETSTARGLIRNLQAIELG